jgi:hypothetical protein
MIGRLATHVSRLWRTTRNPWRQLGYWLAGNRLPQRARDTGDQGLLALLAARRRVRVAL